MKPRQPDEQKSDELFRSQLTQIINVQHELAKLARRIDWNHIDRQVAPFFATEGRPAIRSRLMVGLHLLKSLYHLSDEAVCERWVENPYYQYFCGEDYFQHTFPIQRSSMTHWRKRVGEKLFETLLQESLRIAFEEKALNITHLKRVVVDTTVQPKAVAFPTDVGLMRKALAALTAQASDNGIVLRQTYTRVVKRAAIKSGRYRHAKHLKRAKREEQFIRVRLGRVIRDISRKIQGNDALQAVFSEPLSKALTIQKQQRHSKHKLYSWHAPETECIGKGKAHKPYEFGCKVSVTTHVNAAPGGHFVLQIGALHGNPFDGHTLAPVMESYKQLTGVTPERIYVDKGYQGNTHEPKSRVFKSGQKRGVVGTIKKELRRRTVVEPVIGHMKSDHSLGRNFLQGTAGDKLNALMAGIGSNFRLLLRWLRLFCAQIMLALYQRTEKDRSDVFCVAAI
jgi:IS5 family transposase